MILTALAVAALLGQATPSTPPAAETVPAAETAKPAADAVTPPPPPPPPPVDPWKGNVGFGLIALTGNANAVTLTTNVGADKKWSGWGIGIRANAAYGQSQPTASASPEVVALRAGLSLKGERDLTDWISLFIAGAAETDHVKSMEYRATGEAGAGFTVLNEKVEDLEKMFLKFDLAFRYSHESRYQYYPTPMGLPTADIVAPRIGLVFRYAFNKAIRFSEEAETILNFLGSFRALINSNTKLSARLTEALAVNVAFLVTEDTLPAPGKKQADTALTVGLEASF